MNTDEIITILEKEAEKCQSFADECERKGSDDDSIFYWVGKRRGFLDSLKYIKRLEAEE